MTTAYRIYRFDGGSRIEMAEWIDAPDDEEAIRQTRKLGLKAAKCELWQHDRLVVALNRQDLGG